MENLFSCLCSSLMFPANRQRFLKGEGPHLMNLMLKWDLVSPMFIRFTFCLLESERHREMAHWGLSILRWQVMKEKRTVKRWLISLVYAQSFHYLSNRQKEANDLAKREQKMKVRSLIGHSCFHFVSLTIRACHFLCGFISTKLYRWQPTTCIQ